MSELLPANVPQILINRERLPHKTFDIELLGNCDAIVNEICLRLADSEPSFGQIKRSTARQRFTEVLYENLRASSQPQKKKKAKVSSDTNETTTAASVDLPVERLSSLRPRSMKPTADPSSPASSSSSKRRAYSSLKTTSAFNPDICYVSYPPRRYVFTGAEVHFSSDDDSSDDDEELSRKYTE